MIRTKHGIAWWQPIRPRSRQRVLVVSLLAQNPTAIGLRETTAEPVAGVRTLPEEILVWEIFVRLPAKEILRCRAVCRSWRGLTSAPDFLLAHHQRQPSLQLLTLYGTNSTKRAFKHGRPVLGLNDYEDFKLLASCDGLLLLSLSDGELHICNPTTCQSAPLKRLTAAGDISIAALYLHHPSGEYRVIYWKWRRWSHPYYILTVRQGQSPRCIGVPSDIPGINEVMIDWHNTTILRNGVSTTLAPPVVFRNCLHWDLGCIHTGILVFDTVVETFRIMRRPAAATKLCTRVCDMEGSIGFSCNDYGTGTIASRRAIAKIWVLEDYEREVWSFKYHVEIPVEIFRYLCIDTQHLVLSHKGDVLVYRPYTGYMFHYDTTGKLLKEFRWDSETWSCIGHRFKESLVKHEIFLR